jgi:hypothetical protein
MVRQNYSSLLEIRILEKEFFRKLSAKFCSFSMRFADLKQAVINYSEFIHYAENSFYYKENSQEAGVN